MRFEVQLEHFPAPDGGLIFNRIPWDSDLFGFPFYELKCSAIAVDALKRSLSAWLAEISRSTKCLAVAALPPEDIERVKILAGNAFYPVETLVESHLPMSRFKPLIEKKFDHLRMSPAEANDLPALISIAQSSFKTDRLHLDRNIPVDKADERYANWIKDSFKSDDQIFVLRDERAHCIAGFVLTRETRPGVHDMRLAAVDKKYLKTAAGFILYQAVLEECRERGCRLATSSISINNLASLKNVERLGFVAHNAVIKFHWFHDAAHR